MLLSLLNSPDIYRQSKCFTLRLINVLREHFKKTDVSTSRVYRQFATYVHSTQIKATIGLTTVRSNGKILRSGTIETPFNKTLILPSVNCCTFFIVGQIGVKISAKFMHTHKRERE